MGNTGGVLTNGATELLYNEGLLPKHIGFYLDKIEGLPKLIIKDAGVTIPINNAFKYDIFCGNEGAYHGMLVTMDAECPCEECDYEYGFTVISKWQQPGRFNSDVPQRSNFYGGKIDKITCTTGKIDDVHLLKMESEIIAQINNYKPFNTNNIAPAQYATRFYRVSVSNTSTYSLKFTINSVETTITQADAGNNIVEDINGNTTLKGHGVRAIFLTNPGTTPFEIAVFSDNVFTGGEVVDFTLTAGTNTTLKQRSIFIMNRDVDPTIFSIEIDSNIGKTEGINLVRLDKNNIVDSYFVQFVSPDGIDEFIKNSDCKPNAAFSFTNSYKLGTNSKWQITQVNSSAALIYGFIGNDMTGAFVHSFEPSGYNMKLATQTGAFAVLSNDEVFRVFSHQPNFGALAQNTWAQQPLKGVTYCKIILEYEQVIADLVGANHLNTRRGHVNIYVPQATICKKVFNGNNLMADVVLGDGAIGIFEFVELGLSLGQGQYGESITGPSGGGYMGTHY